VRWVAREGRFESLSRLSLAVVGNPGRRARGGGCAECVSGFGGSCRCLVGPSREHPHGSSFVGRPVQVIMRPGLPEISDSECPTCARTLVKRGRLGTMAKLIGLDLRQDCVHGQVRSGKRREEASPDLQPPEIVVEVYRGRGR